MYIVVPSSSTLGARAPLLAFFTIVFGVSLVALAVVGPPSLHPRGGPQPAALVMFPIMVITVGVAGVVLTGIVNGPRAARDLLGGVRRWRVGARYYLALLIPPACILAVLVPLGALVTPALAPGFFAIGIVFGAVAGFFEEFGWSGFAYPRMTDKLEP